MHRLQVKLETSIDKLHNEVGELLNELEKDRKTLHEKISKATSNMRLNIFFDVLKGIGIVSSVFFPGSAIVGSIVGAIEFGTGIGEKFTGPVDGLPDRKLPGVLNKLDAFNKKMKNEYDSNISLLMNQLDTANVQMLGEKNVIAEAKSVLKAIIDKYSDIHAVQKQIHNVIKSSKIQFDVASSKELRRLQITVYLTDPKAIESYNKIYQAIQMPTPKGRSYSDNVNMLEAELEEVEENIRKSSDYKQVVDTAMRSHLHDFTGLLKSLADGSTEATSIGLEISRFKIKETFEDMKVQLNRFSAGFEANEDLISCINTMEYLMTTVINVYDQLQTANDQTKLGNLITNINTMRLTDFNTDDEALDEAMQNLEYTLVSSTIQNQFTRAVNSFIQLVFPFAPLFLEGIGTNEDLSTSEDGNEALKLISTKLDKLVTTVNSMESSIIQT
jgi:hypothetical protein